MTSMRLAGLCACLMAWLAAGPAAAHVTKDAAWHPVAKAYLFGIFVTDLRPIDWPGIARRYGGVDYEDQGGKSIYDLFTPIDASTGGRDADAIRRAIAKKDRGALRAASTRALARAVTYHMDNAWRAYAERPTATALHIATAQQVFRPFSTFIGQADPDGFRALGLAWLELSTLAGKARATAATDAASFKRAADVIERYARDNYLDAATADLARRGPVPDRGRGRDPGWRPAPWLPPDTNIADQDPLPRLVLNFEQRGVDERDFFLAAYGDMLFDSPEIFGEPARSLGLACSTCHNRGDINRTLFIPGLSKHAGGLDVDSSHFNRRANDMRLDPVDIPSLRGIRYTAPYGRDGRIASLREFTRAVIVGEFAGAEPTPLMLDALIAYMNEFDFLPAPYLDRSHGLNDRAPAAAKRGEKIFQRQYAQMGGRSCAGCHIPSANFADARRHDIGSAMRSSAYARDAAFDTPTLLGIAHTAPYFHDGSLGTLADVVDWFDTRYDLAFTTGDKRDLTAYLTAIGTGAEPYEKFDRKNTRFRLGFDELSTFVSTLDDLIPARDAFHARLLLRTVARDMRADAGGLSDVSLAPKVYELANILRDIDRAIAGGDWARAAVLWDTYKKTEKRHAATLH